MKVLITGGNRGLGFELVKVFHENGHVVFPLVRREGEIDTLHRVFPSRCFPILADLSSDDSIDLIKEQLKQYTEVVDLIINNAGIPGKETEILHTTSEELMAVFNIHCLGVIRAVKGSYCSLIKSKNPRIINISSRLGSLSKMAAQEFPQGQFSYSYRIAKAAQNMLTLCLQQEFEETGIVVTAIHPGKLKTEMGAYDADMTSSEGAYNMYNWVMSTNHEVSGKFIDPSLGELGW
ncbi:SDR family NAD(P)-dependent oxidoreductase [Bacillus pfraonensis]|uniref:SDR family NAD(P)-dependent oxidoreductase n=1 Tax=Bacillus TaxID=1386 RepID=UPI003012CA7C